MISSSWSRKPGAPISATTSPGASTLTTFWAAGPWCWGTPIPRSSRRSRSSCARAPPYFQLSEPAVALAEEICRAVPCAEQLRYASSGSEATFFALRVARAFRKRDRILKFEGGFHGTHDYSLMSVGPRVPKAFPAPTPDSAGIPHAISEEVLIAPFNDLAETEAILAAHHESLAAVIMEPFQRLVVPDKAFLAGVREVTRRYGVPLIFDEIVTGFRFAYGGAQEYYGVVPDLAALGKIIGGGFPLAAVVGSEEIMRHLAPSMEATGDFVQQAGTLNGNPVAAAAGLATLAELRKPGTYARLFETGNRVKTGSRTRRGRLGSRRRSPARRRFSRSTPPTGPSPTTGPRSPPTVRSMRRSPARCSSGALSRPLRRSTSPSLTVKKTSSGPSKCSPRLSRPWPSSDRNARKEGRDHGGEVDRREMGPG